jgi:PAS domain S-box-containing protein
MKSLEESLPSVGSSRTTMKIVVLYVMGASLWILSSDRLLAWFISDAQHLTWLQTIKGWLFVVVTAFCLYWLIRRGLEEIERAARVRWETEARFQGLFQATPVAIWEADLSQVKAGLDSLQTVRIKDYRHYFARHEEFVDRMLTEVRILNVNKATLNLFAAGSVAEFLEGMAQIFTPESRQAFCNGLAAIARGAGVFEAEVPVLTLVGERRMVMVRLELPLEPNNFANVPVCMVDITERRRTEEMLRLLESAVRHSREAMTITTSQLDPPGPEIVFVNQAFTRMTGYSEQEVLGKTPRILQGPRTDQEQMQLMRQHLWQRQTFQCETINYRKDGSEFINEWTVAPILDNNFTVTHFVAVQRDVTERRKNEGALKENLALLSVIFDQAFQLMGLLQPDGTLIKINRTAADFIRGRDIRVLGKPFWETPWWAHSPEEQQRLRTAVAAAARGEFIRYETSHRNLSGGLITVDFSLKPVLDDGGKVVLLVAEGRDITDLKWSSPES